MARHSADLVSLAFGLLFAAMGVALLFGSDVDALSLEWLAPVVAIALGALLVVGARSNRATTEER